jgi:hypothetical protein
MLFLSDRSRTLLYCLLTTLVGIGMLVWSTTIEEHQPLVYWAGLLAVAVGGVSGVGMLLAMLWEG